LKKKYTSNTHCLSAFTSTETSNKKIRRSDHQVLTLPSSLEGREELGVRNEPEPEKTAHCKQPLPPTYVPLVKTRRIQEGKEVI
jgi:hypothetical protein